VPTGAPVHQRGQPRDRLATEPAEARTDHLRDRLDGQVGEGQRRGAGSAASSARQAR
jgi:hypothetical protein